MSDKGSVHRLHAEVALEREQRYYQCATTLGLAAAESSDHLYLRLLSFALFYETDLIITPPQNHQTHPDIYNKDQHWGVFIGVPANHLLKRFAHQFKSIQLIIFEDELNQPYFEAHKLQYFPVWCLERCLVRELEDENERHHHWAITYVDDQLSVTTRHNVYTARLRLWPGMRIDHETMLHLAR
jgi:uncharacterized protein YaeQ